MSPHFLQNCFGYSRKCREHSGACLPVRYLRFSVTEKAILKKFQQRLIAIVGVHVFVGVLEAELILPLYLPFGYGPENTVGGEQFRLSLIARYVVSFSMHGPQRFLGLIGE